MKTLQGWSDVTVTHFRDLGVYGEADPAVDPVRRLGHDQTISCRPGNWARYWRPEIQSIRPRLPGSDRRRSDTGFTECGRKSKVVCAAIRAP